MKPTKLSDILEEAKTTRGQWRLGPDHELQYRAKDKDEEYKLTGALVAVEPDALVFSVTERQADQTVVTSIHKLAGVWKLNPKNQITFEVEKEQGKNDVLTFKNGWQVNNDHEIVYTYEKTRLKRKTKEARALLFKGYWDISEKNRITYLLGGDSNSAFRFRGAVQTRGILAKKGEIRYQIGVEVQGKPLDSARDKYTIQTIALFGKWRISRDLSLDFEIEYADGRRKTITFGGDFALNDTTQVSVNLKSRTGRPLGIELIFTKDVFGKDGQAFVRLQKSLEESRIEAGVKF